MPIPPFSSVHRALGWDEDSDESSSSPVGDAVVSRPMWLRHRAGEEKLSFLKKKSAFPNPFLPLFSFLNSNSSNTNPKLLDLKKQNERKIYLLLGNRLCVDCLCACAAESWCSCVLCSAMSVGLCVVVDRLVLVWPRLDSWWPSCVTVLACVMPWVRMCCRAMSAVCYGSGVCDAVGFWFRFFLCCVVVNPCARFLVRTVCVCFCGAGLCRVCVWLWCLFVLSRTGRSPPGMFPVGFIVLD